MLFGVLGGVWEGLKGLGGPRGSKIIFLKYSHVTVGSGIWNWLEFSVADWQTDGQILQNTPHMLDGKFPTFSHGSCTTNWLVWRWSQGFFKRGYAILPCSAGGMSSRHRTFTTNHAIWINVMYCIIIPTYQSDIRMSASSGLGIWNKFLIKRIATKICQDWGIRDETS